MRVAAGKNVDVCTEPGSRKKLPWFVANRGDAACEKFVIMCWESGYPNMEFPTFHPHYSWFFLF